MILKKGGTPAGPKRGRSAIPFPFFFVDLLVNIVLIKKHDSMCLRACIPIFPLDALGGWFLMFFWRFG
jgi:hypothetical protein